MPVNNDQQASREVDQILFYEVLDRFALVARPLFRHIVVATHRDHLTASMETIEHRAAADIAGMHDNLTRLGQGRHTAIEGTVRIGEQQDSNHRCLPLFCANGQQCAIVVF